LNFVAVPLLRIKKLEKLFLFSCRVNVNVLLFIKKTSLIALDLSLVLKKGTQTLKIVNLGYPSFFLSFFVCSLWVGLGFFVLVGLGSCGFVWWVSFFLSFFGLFFFFRFPALRFLLYTADVLRGA